MSMFQLSIFRGFGLQVFLGFLDPPSVEDRLLMDMYPVSSVQGGSWLGVYPTINLYNLPFCGCI